MANWAAGSRGVGPGVKRRVLRIMGILYGRGCGGMRWGQAFAMGVGSGLGAMAASAGWAGAAYNSG